MDKEQDIVRFECTCVHVHVHCTCMYMYTCVCVQMNEVIQESGGSLSAAANPSKLIPVV